MVPEPTNFYNFSTPEVYATPQSAMQTPRNFFLFFFFFLSFSSKLKFLERTSGEKYRWSYFLEEKRL